MKILITTPGLEFGGAERVLSVLSNQWVSMGHEVSLFLTVSKEKPAYDLDERVEVCYCSRETYGVGVAGVIRGIRLHAKKIKADIVLSFMQDVAALTAIALLGMGVPLIYSERNDPTKTNTRKIDRIFRIIVENRAAGFVFQTEGAKRFFKERVQTKSQVILNPMDAERFPVHDFSCEKDEIVSVGRLEPQKNFPLLLNAFSIIEGKFPQIQLCVYGEGSCREALEAQIKDLGLDGRVSLKGAVRDIQTYTRNAKVFAMTSDYEGLPNALLEALAMGLPCVSTDCSPGGARTLIEDGTSGCVVPCGDVEAVASALERLLSDRAYAQVLGQNALNIRQRVSSKKIANQWLQLFYKTAKRRK